MIVKVIFFFTINKYYRDYVFVSIFCPKLKNPTPTFADAVILLFALLIFYLDYAKRFSLHIPDSNAI